MNKNSLLIDLGNNNLCFIHRNILNGLKSGKAHNPKIVTKVYNGEETKWISADFTRTC